MIRETMRHPLLLTLCALVLLVLPLKEGRSQDARGLPEKVQSVPAQRRQILVLKSYQYGQPIPDSIDRGILAMMRGSGTSIDDIFIENLDLARTPGSEYWADVANMLRHKLAGRHIGIILVEGSQAVDFMAGEAKDFFPDAPLFTLIAPDIGPLLGGPRKLMDIPWRVDPAGTLRAALDLFPETQRVFVVTGARDIVLPFLDEARRAFAPWKDKLDFEYTNEMTYEEMLRRISTLPPNTVIIYSPYFNDTSGRSFVPAEVVFKVSQAANAPVFATLDIYLGQGIVGGALLKTEEIGKKGCEVALDYLNGSLKLVEPVTTFDIPTGMIFDWRELTRWKADTSRLPKGSIVINRPPALWGQYKAEVIEATVVFVALIVLTFFLLILNRRLNFLKVAASESEARFRVMVERAPEAIVVYDIDLTRIIDANIKAEQLFGRSRERLLSGGPELLYSTRQPDGADVGENVNDHNKRAMAGEEVVFERAVCTGDGRDLTCEVRLVRLPYHEEWLLRGSFIDITDRKQAEEERGKLEERLQRAEKMEALGTLAGGVAHDLNNVLGIVVGYSELFLSEFDESSSARSDAMEILKGGQRAAAIVQDLLTLARRGVSSRKVLNLNNSVSECLKSPEFTGILSNHPDLEIKADLEADLLNISGSSVHLEKSLINMVYNAVEAMPNGGTLAVKTTNCYLDKRISGYDEVRQGDYVVLSVSDTGEGIPASDLKRIFEPFYTKKVMGRSGTGLGLAVVWGTVKDHLGYINVESEEGKGTTFTLYFPVVRDDISSEHVPISASEYMGNGQHILVVDDVKEQRQLASAMLKKLNYTVASVSSGNDAVKYVQEHAVDLIVLDMIMDPGMDGLDTYIKVLEIHPHQRAIIVSGFSETERVRKTQALGAGVYVKKPYVLEKLGLAVRNELDKSA